MTRRLLLLLPAVAALALVIALAVMFMRAPKRAPHRFAMGRGSTVVMLHGPGGSVQHWLPTARLLARGYRVVLLELPGYGLDAPAEPLSLEAVAAALHTELEADSKEPVVLVGHAVGGLIAAVEALQHPERVRALVLLETPLQPRLEEVERRRMLESIDRDYARVLRRLYSEYGRDSAQGEQLHAEVARMDPMILKPWLRLELYADISLRMRHLKAPLLAIMSERLWPKDQTWEAAAKSLGYPQGVKATRLEGTGHFLMLDRPDELARLIGHFAEDSSRGPVASR